MRSSVDSPDTPSPCHGHHATLSRSICPRVFYSYAGYAVQQGSNHIPEQSSTGEHPKVVQSLLGLSSITQTMDTYSHLMEGMGGNAVGGLDEAFG